MKYIERNYNILTLQHVHSYDTMFYENVNMCYV